MIRRCADPRRENPGALGASRREVREEVPAESSRAIADQIDEKHRENRQTSEHHGEADDDEQLIEQLATRQSLPQSIGIYGSSADAGAHQ